MRLVVVVVQFLLEITYLEAARTIITISIIVGWILHTIRCTVTVCVGAHALNTTIEKRLSDEKTVEK